MERWVVKTSEWDPSPEEFSYALSVLPPFEQSAVNRFVRMEDKKRALVSRLLQYALVHQLLQIPFHQIIINRTLHGKPYLLPIHHHHPQNNNNNSGELLFPNFNFNVSHHGDYVAIASEPLCLVGLDIINHHSNNLPSLLLNDVFSSYFTNFEWCNISAASDTLLEFSRYWCLKEAFVKAIGSGIAFSFNRLEFHHTQWTNISVHVDGQPMTDWQFWLLHLGNDHLVCIARGHPRSAIGDYMTTLKRTEYDDEEFYAALHLPNVEFVTTTVEQLIPLSVRAHVDNN